MSFAVASCRFCDRPATSSYLVRVGTIPTEYDTDPVRHPDRTHLAVVQVCDDHTARSKAI